MAIHASILRRITFLALSICMSNTTFSFLWGVISHQDTTFLSLYENYLLQTQKTSLQWSVLGNRDDLR